MLEKLKKIGLSGKEAIIYTALIKSGESTANEIAKLTSTNRTVTYNILQQLVNKGLISYVNKNKKRVYQISNPEALLSSVKEKEILAKDLIDEINNFNVIPKESKNVEVYEGKEGMKVVFDEIRKSKDLRVINATGLIFEYLKYSAGHILKDIELKGNPKVIACQSLKKTPLVKFKKIQLKYLPKKDENHATTFIFDNVIVIQVLKNKPFIIKIENKDIFEGYKKNFDLLWNRL
jgi:HTH-type transcriptional regulator, sugar sensing transcriptional regulator